MTTCFVFPQVGKLAEMGFPEALVRTTLEAVGGDENLALEKLHLNNKRSAYTFTSLVIPCNRKLRRRFRVP